MGNEAADIQEIDSIATLFDLLCNEYNNIFVSLQTALVIILDTRILLEILFKDNCKVTLAQIKKRYFLGKKK